MRNNENRFHTPDIKVDETPVEINSEQLPKSFSFATPTEIIFLPSEGKFYPETHPYYNKQEVDIYYMTAKEEDILTSQRLIEKGLAFDKLIESVCLDNVPSRTLIIPDRTAILIAARRTGFGDEYKTLCACPKCSKPIEVEADLSKDVKINEITSSVDKEKITFTEKGTFLYRLERLNIVVEMVLMTGQDDSQLFKQAEIRKKKKLHSKLFSSRLEQILVSLNDDDNPHQIKMFSENITLIDAKEILAAYDAVAPSIAIKTQYECEHCESYGVLEVPITKDFFWPE